MKNMNKFSTLYRSLSIALVVIMLAGCNQTDVSTGITEVGDVAITESGTGVSDASATMKQATHSDEVDPNYDVVFNQDEGRTDNCSAGLTSLGRRVTQVEQFQVTSLLWGNFLTFN